MPSCWTPDLEVSYLYVTKHLYNSFAVEIFTECLQIWSPVIEGYDSWAKWRNPIRK